VILVQRCLKAIKARRRARERMHREAARVTVEILAAGAVAVRDGFQARGTYGEVTRDRATLRTRVVFGEGPETGEEVVRRMEGAGDLPLVLGTDNGAPYKSEGLREYLVERKVVHLRSAPRVPQQNGAAECAVKEVKGFLEGVQVGPEGPARRLDDACRRLNAYRLRGSRGYRTSEQLARETPGVYTVDRVVFYEACQRRIRRLVQDAPDRRASRRAEREAIWQTLEAFGLVRRYRGGVLIPPAQPEIFS
jgi:transposase InsO family protein